MTGGTKIRHLATSCVEGFAGLELSTNVGRLGESLLPDWLDAGWRKRYRESGKALQKYVAICEDGVAWK
jgi:hypothetical protein